MLREVDELVNGLKIAHQSNLGSRVDAEYLDRIESHLGAPLPVDLRHFLEITGGVCKSESGQLFFVFSGGGSVLSLFFGTDPDGAYDLLANLDDYDGRVPTQLLPIAEDFGSNLVCVGVKGDYVGKVYFWLHDDEGPEDEEFWGNLVLISPDFCSFLQDLHLKPY